MPLLTLACIARVCMTGFVSLVVGSYALLSSGMLVKRVSAFKWAFCQDKKIVLNIVAYVLSGRFHSTLTDRRQLVTPRLSLFIYVSSWRLNFAHLRRLNSFLVCSAFKFPCFGQLFQYRCQKRFHLYQKTAWRWRPLFLMSKANIWTTY